MSEEEFGYALSGDELRRVITMPASERMAYFVDKCREQGQVWTIGADDELVVLAGEEDQPFIVAFPHPEFGQDWFSTTDLDDVDLVAVSTADWRDEILPALAESDIQALVFPTSEGEGILTDCSELATRFA